MKRFFTTIVLSIFLTKIFSLELNFQIDLESDIKNKNYYYEFTKNRELYVEKIINLGEEVEIKQINFQILSYMDKLFLEKRDNPEISTGDYKTNLKESPLSHFQYKIANSGKDKILILHIFPYLENLADKKSIKNIKVNVIYEKVKSSILNSYYDFIYPDKKEKKIKILNQNNIDFLIITTEKYINLFNNFIHICRALGFNTQIVSVESILQEVSGVDFSQTIRNYIKKIYYENGLRFLLLGGDTEIIPSRNVISDLYYYVGVYPSDLYYGDVHGEWNKDNDEIIGEIEDIEDGYLDIAISRLPFSNENELINILNKFTDYIFNFDQNKIKNFLHAGASLFSNLSDGSGQLMTNELLTLKEAYSYNNFTMFSPLVDTFHQFPYYTGNIQLNRENFSVKISEGFYFANHIDHSNEFFIGTGLYETNTQFANWDTIFFSGNKHFYTIFFSLGCSPNAFDKLSLSKSLLVSKSSPIISFTGFVRTGWTSAENYMLNFWRKVLSPSTSYLGEALLYSNMNPNIYFRTSINTIGIPILPIYSNRIDTFSIVEKNIDDSIRLKIVDSSGNKNGFLVTLFSNEKIFFRSLTDENGYVSIPLPLIDSKFFVGIFSKDHKLKIDTFSINQRNLQFSLSVLDDTNLVNLKIKNLSKNVILLDRIKISSNDSNFILKDSVENLNIQPLDSILKPIKYLKTFFSDRGTHSPVSISFTSYEKNYLDSTYIYFENDSFKIFNFSVIRNTFNFTFKKISRNYIDTLKVFIKPLDQNLMIIDSTFIFTNVKKDSSITLNNIKFSLRENRENLYDKSISVIFIMKKDTDTISFKLSPPDTSLYLDITKDYKSVKIIKSDTFYCEVYKIVNEQNIFIKRIQKNERFCIDTNFILGENKYFGIFYDNIGRVIDTTEIYTINIFTKILNEKSLLSGSFFGKLNGKSLYAKSSFNYVDFNKDLKNEVIVLSDDGRVIIFNDKLEDITPFKLQTKPYQESTPAIGDIDGNGYYDIVISGGSFSYDTSGYLILNPFNDKKIFPIINYGVLTSSPAVEDIDSDGYYEIFLGTSSGFYLLDKNLNKKWSLNVKNVCGISISKDRRLIFINDFYGNLYAVDFLGKIKEGFPISLKHLTFSPLITGDIDNDGMLDIIVATVDNYIFVVKENGKIKEGFPFYTNYPIYSTPTLSDLNDDGKMEIISLNKNGYLYIVDYEGKTLFCKNTGFLNNLYNQPLIYDFDGDGTKNIIMISNNGYLINFDFSFNKLDTLSFLNSTFTSTPIVFSFDNSDQYKIIIKDLYGKIYIIDNFSSGKKRVIFGKTLYDLQNRSYIINESITRLNLYDKKEISKSLKSFKVSCNIFENSLNILNNLYPYVELKVYNIVGAKVFSEKIKNFQSSQKVKLGLSSGKYYFQIYYLDKLIYDGNMVFLKK